MQDFWMDLRYSLRMLLRNPGFALAAILALGLGIGANTAIFSVVNGVLLNPLPYRQPERLVSIFENYRAEGRERNEVASGNYLDWVVQAKVFEALGAYGDTGANLSGGGEAPERVLGAVVTDGVLRLLRVSPQLGRIFTPEEEATDARVVILSDSLWRRRFGADPHIVGRDILINRRPRQVVGVMPPGFQFPPDQDKAVWAPLGLPAMGMMAQDRGSRFLHVVGRLKPGISVEKAQAEMDVLARRLAARYPDTNAGWGVTVVPLDEQVVGDVRPALLILLTTTAFVLLIACSNVTNLLLARSAAREREVAVRAALGAGRRRLIRQYLTESTLLALLGGLLGLLLAYWGIRLLLATNPDYIPRLGEIGIDLRALGFTLAISLLTGIVFGLVPAFKASRSDLHEPLKEGGRGSSNGMRQNRLRSLLVVSQTALALILLVGAGLMVRSLLGLQRIDPGFDPTDALTMEIFLSSSKYDSQAALDSFHRQLLERIGRLPGVESVGEVTNLPLGGSDWTISFTVEGQPPPPGKLPEVSFRGVTPDYFRAAGIALVQGRSFRDTDTSDSPKVAIINQTMAERNWPKASPVGRRLVSHDVPYEIVGVVRDVRYWGLNEPVRPELFLPLTQDAYYFTNLVVRSGSEPRQLLPLLRRELRAIDPDQPVYNIRTLDEVLARSISRSNLYTRLLLIFAGLALLLAALGIYSVIAYSVHQRSHEIGIRMALGARSADVLRLIVGQGWRISLGGVLLGLLFSLGVTRVLSSLLYGVSINDPLTFGGAAVLLAGVALAACYLPARRATQINPIVTLREE